MNIQFSTKASSRYLSDFIFIFITLFYLFFYQIEKRIPYGTTVGIAFILYSVISQFNKNQYKITSFDILLYMAVVLISLTHLLFFNNNYFYQQATDFLFLTVSFYFAGLLTDYSKYETEIYRISVVYLLLNVYFLFTTFARRSNLTTDNLDHMALAYQGLFSTLFICYRAIKTKKTIPILCSIAGIMFLIMCGTRGPILCAMVCALFFVFKYSYGNNKVILSAIIIVIVLVPVLLNIKSIAIGLYPIFTKYHVSTRILSYIVSDVSLREGTGREYIYSTVINSITSHPFFGNGLMGEREILNGAWSHNLILEFLNSFGIPFGVGLLCSLSFIIFKAGKRCFHSDQFYMFSILFSCSVVRLLMSSSFIEDKFLFLFIGYCVNVLRTPIENQ